MDRKDARGERWYNDDALDRVGRLPGFMSKFCALVSKSDCGEYPCTCSGDCYEFKEEDDGDFMVPA